MTPDVNSIVAELRAETALRTDALRIERDRLAKELAKRGVIEIPMVGVVR